MLLWESESLVYLLRSSAIGPLSSEYVSYGGFLSFALLMGCGVDGQRRFIAPFCSGFALMVDGSPW